MKTIFKSWIRLYKNDKYTWFCYSLLWVCQDPSHCKSSSFRKVILDGKYFFTVKDWLQCVGGLAPGLGISFNSISIYGYIIMIFVVNCLNDLLKCDCHLIPLYSTVLHFAGVLTVIHSKWFPFCWNNQLLSKHE